MTTRLIANKYREGKVKRTLKRELKVLEIVKGEANIAVGYTSARSSAMADRQEYPRETGIVLLERTIVVVSCTWWQQRLISEAKRVDHSKTKVFAMFTRYPGIERVKY